MNKNVVILSLTVLLVASLWVTRGEAQQPSQIPTNICSGFQISGMNATSRWREDRESRLFWDIRAAELPPGWQPIGVVNEGAGRIAVYACRTAPSRPGWGEHRINIRPG